MKLGPIRGLVDSGGFSALLKLLEAASYFCAIVTLVVIARQLDQDAHERRVTKSLEMISAYRQEPLWNARAAVRDFEAAHSAELTAIQQGGGLSTEEAQIWVEGRLKTYDQRFPDRKIFLALRELAGYFDEVAICEMRKICDTDVMRSFLEPEARDLSCSYGSVIAEQGKIFARKELGYGLKLIAQKSPCASH